MKPYRRGEWDRPSGKWSESGQDWNPEMMARRRHMARQFGCFVVAITVSFVALLVGGLVLFLRAADLNIGTTETVLLVLCSMPLVLVIVVANIVRLFFLRVGAPVADMMAAADAIAAGDLSVRVPENSQGDIGRLAARFNRMTAELQRSEQQRRHLTADVAHELRTPLHILQGNLEGLLDGIYEPTPAHIAATLDEAHALTRLVNDLQLLSLAEAGELPLHRQPVVVADLLAAVVGRFAAAAVEAGVTIVVEDAKAHAGLTVDADPDRLEQVLSNLVGNALRHTAAGGRVVLTAESVEKPDRSGKPPFTVCLTVSDTGVGIPAEDLPYIFDRFWRGDRSRTREGGAGSGLGLAIARQLVLAHGGEITADSEVGVGTVVTVWLPGLPPESGA
jgi:two-component system OmpR family sensor kinase/two-component system sensor histidine kinase BaeS